MLGPKVDSNALSLDWKENFFFYWFYFQIIYSTNIHWCKEVSDSELHAWCTKPNSIWFLFPSVLQSPRGGRLIHSIHSYCLSMYFMLATILGAWDAKVEHIYKDTCPEGLYILLGVVLGKTADLQSGKYMSKWWIFWFKPRICVCQRFLEAGMAGLCHNFPSLEAVALWLISTRTWSSRDAEWANNDIIMITYPPKNTLKIICLFLAVLGLSCCVGFSLASARGGYFLVAVLRLLIEMASLIAEQSRGCMSSKLVVATGL